MESYEESAKNWMLEQRALAKQQEVAEAAAREAERQAMEEAARHLAEGKLVPGANLEVILTDPGPVGLTFHADSEPPRVRKVKKERREFWEKQGMEDGAAILAVGDTPTTHMTSGELLPLLNGRPLRLQFALGDVTLGINGADKNGQTALHRALEKGDEAAALQILADPDFKSVNLQEPKGISGICMLYIALLSLLSLCEVECEDNLGKTALHWAASTGQADACQAILSAMACSSMTTTTALIALETSHSTSSRTSKLLGQTSVNDIWLWHFFRHRCCMWAFRFPWLGAF